LSNHAWQSCSSGRGGVSKRPCDLQMAHSMRWHGGARS